METKFIAPHGTAEEAIWSKYHDHCSVATSNYHREVAPANKRYSERVARASARFVKETTPARLAYAKALDMAAAIRRDDLLALKQHKGDGNGEQ